MIELKNSNYDKTQKLKMLPNSIDILYFVFKVVELVGVFYVTQRIHFLLGPESDHLQYLFKLLYAYTQRMVLHKV